MGCEFDDVIVVGDDQIGMVGNKLEYEKFVSTNEIVFEFRKGLFDTPILVELLDVHNVRIAKFPSQIST